MTSAAEAKKVLKWFSTKRHEGHPNCPLCGHDGDAHKTVPNEPGKGVRVVCPALPPAKQVTVDEAVVAKGGRPSTDFERELAAASGETEQAEKKRRGEENFDRRPVFLERRIIRLKDLQPMKDNPRGEDLGDLEGLRKSIENTTFVGALVVRPLDDEAEQFEVIIGNRRLKAAKLAGLLEVPCDVYELTDGQALEMNLAEQINRNDLTPLKEGESCRKLMELQGYDEHQVAEKFGKSKSWVISRVALCGLAPELKKALAAGELSLTKANALAALPTQQLQVKTHEKTLAGTAEEQVFQIRNAVCRPLSEATWKLTDADLLPEAGACSTCPFNSATNAMPGLFDNARAKPTCAKTECFDDKANEAWLVKTEKLRSNGAKALSLAEGRKLFHGAGGPLPESSRYVEATEKPKKDRKGRTWDELANELPDDARPQLHLAQDGAGKMRQLYVGDKLREAIATHLKLKWAAESAEEATSSKGRKSEAKLDEELKAKHQLMSAYRLVTGQVLATVAAKLAQGPQLARPALVFLAESLFSFREGDEKENFGTVLGRKLPKDWVQKGATNDELVALAWWLKASREFDHPWNGLDERFEAIAKAHGFKLEDMVKAQLATAKAEAEKGGKS